MGVQVADVEEINRFLQARLRGSGRQSASAVDAARWLDEHGLLRDSPSRPGKPLRDLLRGGLIEHGRQDARWWHIYVAGPIGPPTVDAQRSRPEQSASTGGTGTAFDSPDAHEYPADARFESTYRVAGFHGFVSLGDAVASPSDMIGAHARDLTQCGVYAIFSPRTWVPEFLCEDLPNVIAPRSYEVLQARWIREVELVYIGCAGANAELAARCANGCVIFSVTVVAISGTGAPQGRRTPLAVRRLAELHARLARICAVPGPTRPRSRHWGVIPATCG